MDVSWLFVCFNPGFTPESLLFLKFCPTSQRWFCTMFMCASSSSQWRARCGRLISLLSWKCIRKNGRGQLCIHCLFVLIQDSLPSPCCFWSSALPPEDGFVPYSCMLLALHNDAHGVAGLSHCYHESESIKMEGIFRQIGCTYHDCLFVLILGPCCFCPTSQRWFCTIFMYAPSTSQWRARCGRLISLLSWKCIRKNGRGPLCIRYQLSTSL